MMVVPKVFIVELQANARQGHVLAMCINSISCEGGNPHTRYSYMISTWIWRHCMGSSRVRW